jgi:nucleoid DNA-binding protein
MNRRDLIQEVSRETGLDGDQVAAALDTFLRLVASDMSIDEANSLFGFNAIRLRPPRIRQGPPRRGAGVPHAAPPVAAPSLPKEQEAPPFKRTKIRRLSAAAPKKAAVAKTASKKAAVAKSASKKAAARSGRTR